ncbi:MAG: helix-turn-helix transcriptional regulator [Melioribacteraceae bacterium]|jgi:DNA-binding PadR family transcriptional regulator|nr:helix-turn-helix transcriptional regulator [Melioribacteraceae bacterium]
MLIEEYILLPKLSTLILGILAEQEISPYQLNKLLKDLDTKKWFPIAESTVYATVTKLKSKGLIEGRKERLGKLPERTIYRITTKGEEEFKSAVSNYFDRMDSDTSRFDIAILLMHNLDSNEIQKRLKKKLEMLESNYYDIRKQLLSLEIERHKVGFTTIAMLKHRLHKIEAEIKTIKEIIKELNTTKNSSQQHPFDFRMNN